MNKNLIKELQDEAMALVDKENKKLAEKDVSVNEKRTESPKKVPVFTLENMEYPNFAIRKAFPSGKVALVYYSITTQQMLYKEILANGDEVPMTNLTVDMYVKFSRGMKVLTLPEKWWIDKVFPGKTGFNIMRRFCECSKDEMRRVFGYPQNEVLKKAIKNQIVRFDADNIKNHNSIDCLNLMILTNYCDIPEIIEYIFCKYKPFDEGRNNRRLIGLLINGASLLAQIKDKFGYMFACRFCDEFLESYIYKELDTFEMYSVCFPNFSTLTPQCIDEDSIDLYRYQYTWKCLSDLFTYIPQTSNYKDFSKYVFRTAAFEGFAYNWGDFFVEWFNCLVLQEKVYGKVINLYPEMLKSAINILYYKAQLLKAGCSPEDIICEINNDKEQ